MTPAQREVHQVRGLEVGPGAMVTEGGHPRDDQGRTLLHQRVRAQPEPVELSPGRGLQQHVGGGDERAEPVSIFALAQIEHDRALPAVVLPEEERALGVFPVLVEGTDAARGAAAGRLHLDDVGAETRQGQPAVLRLLVGQLDDADAGERAPAGCSGAANGTLGLGCPWRQRPTSPALRACGPGPSRTRARAARSWRPACRPPRSGRTRPSRRCAASWWR